jgi:transposase
VIHPRNQTARDQVGVEVWLATAPVDMRRSFDGLAEHVRAFLGHDPLSGSMFVFRNRSSQRVKILWWDKDGLAIYYKRLEKGTFQFPAAAPGGACGGKAVAVDSAALMRLLSGLKLEATAARRAQRECASDVQPARD